MNPNLVMIKCHFCSQKCWVVKKQTPALQVDSSQGSTSCLPAPLLLSLEYQEQDPKHCYYLFCSDRHVAALKPALYHARPIVRAAVDAQGKDPEMVLCAPGRRVAWLDKAAPYIPQATTHSPDNSSSASTARGGEMLGNKALFFHHRLRFIPLFKSFAISQATICNREF